MISFLKSNPGTPIPDAEIRERYNRLRLACIIWHFLSVTQRSTFYVITSSFRLQN